jgi:hypothetical protein
MLAPPASFAQPSLSLEQFERSRRLALKLAGIELVDRHRELLARRQSRQAFHRRTALERIATLLAPGGLLMLDPAEHLADAAARAFTPVASGVFLTKANP